MAFSSCITRTNSRPFGASLLRTPQEIDQRDAERRILVSISCAAAKMNRFAPNHGDNMLIDPRIDSISVLPTFIAARKPAMTRLVATVTRTAIENSLPRLCTVAADAQTITATVNVGTGPFSAAVNPVTNKIYVVNRNSNNVTVIDGATNT